MTETTSGATVAPDRLRAAGWVALGVAIAAWVVVLFCYLRNRIALSPDSLNNYAHVWWIARGVWHHHSLPWTMPVLGSGEGLTFPYGFVNWTTAALAWPLGGDVVTTWWTAIGTVGVIGATFVAFPELRTPWWATAVLCNPVIVLGLLFGQQTFLWSAALFLFGVAAWRRDRPLAAALLIGVAQANHAAVVLPMGCLVVGTYLVVSSDRRRAARWYCLSLLVALPSALLVLASPAFESSSTRDRVFNFFSTLAPRALVVAVPIGFVYLARRSSGRARRVVAPLAVVVMILANFALNVPLRGYLGWRTLQRTEQRASMERFLGSPVFDPSATTRLLRGADSRLGMYMILEAGGRLDGEFFPESQAIRDFDSVTDYVDLLCDRAIDRVVVFDTYDATRRTNEHERLEQLVDGVEVDRRVTVERVEHDRQFDVYTVERRC